MATYESKESKGKEYGSQGIAEFLTEAVNNMRKLNEITERTIKQVNSYRNNVNAKGIREPKKEEHLKNQINKLTEMYDTIQRKIHQNREKLENEARELLRKDYGAEAVRDVYVREITELEEWENQMQDKINELQKLRKQLEELGKNKNY